MKSNKYSKPYKSPEELIQHLLGLGLIIDNHKKATEIIGTVGYFHFKGYLASFKNKKNFKLGTTFEDVTNLLVWERNLRNLLLAQIGKFELRLRVAIVDEIGRGDGLSYLDTWPFIETDPYNPGLSSDTWGKWVKVRDSVITKSKRDDQHVFIQNFLRLYDSEIPLWILIETFTFGQLRDLFIALKKDHQDNIAQQFANPAQGVLSLSGNEFDLILSLLVIFRNNIAHNNVFWDKEFKLFKAPIDTRTQLAHSSYFSDRTIFERTYGIILILLFLENSFQSDSKWREEVSSCIMELSRMPRISLRDFGAPANWHMQSPLTNSDLYGSSENDFDDEIGKSDLLNNRDKASRKRNFRRQN